MPILESIFNTLTQTSLAHHSKKGIPITHADETNLYKPPKNVYSLITKTTHHLLAHFFTCSHVISCELRR